MVKKLILLATVLLSLTFLPSIALAQETSTAPAVITKQTATSSFELFWPLSAGTTIDSPLYFLKSLKEKIRGMLIFGTPQKADYETMLGTKRALEVERLLSSNKEQPTLKTLDLAIAQFNSADRSWQKVTDKAQAGDAAQSMGTRLSRLTPFLTSLSQGKSPAIQDKINQLIQQINNLSSKL